MWLSAILLFLLLHSKSLANNSSDDIVQLPGKLDCESSCWFNESQITSDTISSWPTNCPVVCGTISLTGSSEVPLKKLKSAFEKLETLKGGINITSTTLSDLSIFPNLKKLECESTGILISHNQQLVDISVFYGVEFSGECPFEVVNNPKLDVTTLCVNPNYGEFVGMRVTDNLKDCGCRAEHFGTKQFQGCTSVFGALHITKATENDVASLASVRNVTGSITIANTSLTNLSFFQNLERLKAYSSEQFALDIRNNPNLTGISIDALEALLPVGAHGSQYLTMNIQNNHPNFCITPDELQFFVSFGTTFTHLDGSMCPFMYQPTYNLCSFSEMMKLNRNCIVITGNVLITSGDETYTVKLRTVTAIFGSVTIQNTNLTDVSFFAELQQVMVVNDSPAIQITSNPRLHNLTFPNLKFPFNSGNKSMVVNDTPYAFRESVDCVNLQNQVLVPVSYQGDGCGKVDVERETVKYVEADNRARCFQALLVISCISVLVLFSN